MRPNEEGVPTDPNGGVRPTRAETENAKVSATIGNWKRKLLDVSKRNRTLNFKPTKVSKVTVLDEQPAEVFRHLYLQDRQMRFRPAPPKVEAGTAPATAELPYDQLEENAEEFTQSPDFVPYDAVALGDHHRDDLLQTSLQAEDLDKALRRIAHQARVSIVE